MTKRRRILHADKIIQNVIHVFCLLMFLQLKGYYSLANNPILLYSTTSDIRVANISKLAKTNIIVKGLKQGSAVDFIHRKNLICWSDQNAELIQCMNYNETHSGEKMRIVSEGLISPIGIAIDWYTDKIYWTDGETNRIEVISIEQKHRKVLFWSEVDLARAIAVVPKEGLLFWTDWGEEPKIERAGMNGDPKTRKIIVKDNIIWPNGITVDYNNNLIYWVDAKLHFIDVIDFNGEKRKRIVEGGLEYPYAITIFNEKFYWTDWTNWAIHSWDMATNGPIKELIKSDPVPVDIKVYDGSRQLIPPGDYPCKINNGGCSHLCLLSPSAPGFTCACPTGTALMAGSRSACHSRPQALLLVAQRSVISRISLDSPDYTPYALPLRDLKRALTVDFDPVAEFIYWADNLAKTISRARLDGSAQAVVARGAGPDGVAVDPLARNLYWTDPVQDTISVARLDGTSLKVLIHEDLYDPRAIALHPGAGWMFWSDWSERRPRIERAALDGGARTPLVTERLAWPNGLALDAPARTLYWGDARTHKIEAIDMDGSNRREIHGADIQHIFGLALLDGRLYWTDMQRRTLDSVDKDSGADRQPVVEQLANMMGLKAVRLGAALPASRCAGDNGGCSHLCFNRPADRVCGCPLGLELGADLATCAEPEAFLVYARKNEIGHVGLGRPASRAVLPVRDLGDVSALDVDVSGSKIYWADSKTRTISRCPATGGNSERLLDGLAVDGLAIDWSAQNMYWTDASAGRIELARLDGSSRRALLWQGLRKPKSIALDPRRGHMYWSELGARCIKRAGMDGAGARVAAEAAGRAHALALGPRALYWAALDPPALHELRLDSGARRTLAPAAPMPTALALHATTLYWGDWNTGQISAMNLSEVSARREVARQLDYVTELKVFHRARAAAGRCGVDNGGCQHLCVPAAAPAYRCACPTHYRLQPDNLTCSEPEEFLLFAQKNTVGRIVVANGECNDASIPIVGLKNIRAIDYDPQKKMLYWIEEESNSIRRVPMSHAPTSVAEAAEVGRGPRPLYLALDVLGRALYWTAQDADSINATAIDAAAANASVVIVRAAGLQPRQLAVHQDERLLVWVDAGRGAIMRANADGSDLRELARAPNASALALDQHGAFVYWACARQIHRVDLDARNGRVVWQGGWVGTLAAYGGALYLSGGERALMRLPLARRDAPAAPVPHVARLHASAVVRAVSRSHPCFGGRACGGGAGACLAGGACGCGGCGPRPACARDRFPCAPDASLPDARAYCIPDYWRCDGQKDCPDGSDEGPGCGACAAGVRCAGGACAAALANCGAGAPCPRRPLPGAFRCDDKLCLSPGLLCDGRPHCKDGSDEAPTLCSQKDQVPSAQPWSAAAACGAAAGCGAAAAALWALLRCRRTRAPRPPRPPRPPRARSDARATPAAAEASESLCARYPLPTANPPPSPATASGGSGRRRAYRHYRASNRPPPPTPASTDACESEPEPAARAPPPSPAPDHAATLY